MNLVTMADYDPMNDNEWLIGVFDHNKLMHEDTRFRQYLSLQQGRPDALPEVIDIFLWGELVFLVHQKDRRFLHRSVLIMMAAFISFNIVFFFLIATELFTDVDGEVDAFWVTIFVTVIVFLLLLPMLWCRSKSYEKTHTRIQKVVEDKLAPKFQAIGYDITYVREPLLCGAITAGLIRLRAMTRQETEYSQHPVEQAVIMTQYMMEQRIYVTNGSKIIFPIALEELDASVKGAITETVAAHQYPLRAQYDKMITRLELCTYFVYWLIFTFAFDDDDDDDDNDDQEREMTWELKDSVYLAIFLSPLFVAVIVFILLRRSNQARSVMLMEESIIDISPLMQQRKGYGLEFVKEEAHTSYGYIRFLPASTTLAQPSESMIPAPFFHLPSPMSPIKYTC
jgi:hypothetical protein